MGVPYNGRLCTTADYVQRPIMYNGPKTAVVHNRPLYGIHKIAFIMQENMTPWGPIEVINSYFNIFENHFNIKGNFNFLIFRIENASPWF